MPTRELADWWTRAGAFVLDQLIVGAGAYAIAFVLSRGIGRGVLRTVLAQQLLIAVTVYVYGLVDYLWPIGDRRNQALHDKIANTLVVRAPAREAPRGQWLPPQAPSA